MNVVIIEDEDLAAISLEKLLLKSPHSVSVIKRLTSVKESINWLKDNTCDLIFSDIHLGDGDSFEIFNALKTQTPIIFTTAYDEYAIKSFQFHAIDYLLKPYDKSKLYSAIEKHLALTSKKNTKNKLKELIKQMHFSEEEKQNQKRFLVPKGNQLISIKTEHIAYFMAQGKHLFLYTKEGEEYLYKDTISNLENKLSSRDFFKINRKYIVHHSAIKNMIKYSNNRIKVELEPKLKSEELIFVSAQKNNDFKDWLNS